MRHYSATVARDLEKITVVYKAEKIGIVYGAMALQQVIDRPQALLSPTVTSDDVPRRFSDFETLGEALDYAARGERGLNFHDPRGNLTRAYRYAEMQRDALAMAQRMLAYGLQPGDRVALIAETGPEFAALFFGCIYAGAWPVPLPLPTSFGGRDSYVDQLAVQMKSADPVLLLHPAELGTMASDAARAAGTVAIDWESFATRKAGDTPLPPSRPDDIAYLQYSSGSTRFPHGVAVTHRALLNNLSAHSHGMDLQPEDRCVSWLPWYHDMGLVGCFLSPVANQVSTDYLKTEDFARRPLAWLDLISRNKGTTLSYSPTFGYDICSRRISSQSHPADRFDLSRWRVAGNGADMIRPDVMQAFVDAFGDAGFKASAFLPSYGLAEATLAVSIMPPGEGIVVELVEETELSGGTSEFGRPQRYRAIVNCGKPVKDMRVEIRDEDCGLLGERAIGKVWASGPSIMEGYFRDEVATAACMKDGWLDTGDMGYISDGYIYIVGRAKDMIIINGKNHWPQDIEWAVEQLPGFKSGDIAAFSVTTPGGEETPAVLVQCRTTDEAERTRLRETIRDKVRSITGMNCVIELVPPRTLPRTSSGKLSRAKARNQYLSGEIQPYALAA
jgi:fatty-acyl-CoA synthase